MIIIIIIMIIIIIIIRIIIISADRLRWKRFSVSHGDFGVTRSCVNSLSNIEIRPRDQRESQRRRTKMAMHVLLLVHGKSFRFVGACARTIVIIIIIIILKKNENGYACFVACTW